MSRDVAVVAALTVGLHPYCQVDVAATVSEGLQNLAHYCPDLVMLDVLEADVDVLCFLRILSAQRPACQVIVITPLEGANAFWESTTLPIGGFFGKPLDLDAILARIAGLFSLRGDDAPFAKHGGHHVSKTVEYLVRHYRESPTMHGVAEAVGVSASHLGHLFRVATGMTPMACLVQIRVEVAKFLLRHSDDKLEVIATKSGFCDASHLSRVFRRYTRSQPGQYRRHVRRPGLGRRPAA